MLLPPLKFLTSNIHIGKYSLSLFYFHWPHFEKNQTYRSDFKPLYSRLRGWKISKWLYYLLIDEAWTKNKDLWTFGEKVNLSCSLKIEYSVNEVVWNVAYFYFLNFYHNPYYTAWSVFNSSGIPKSTSIKNEENFRWWCIHALVSQKVSHS